MTAKNNGKVLPTHSTFLFLTYCEDKFATRDFLMFKL